MYVRDVPITVARAGVALVHRHLAPPPGALWALELVDDRGPVGWALVGRPVSRILQARGAVEVTRVAVLPPPSGPRNGCSKLYAAAAREARRRGFAALVTYTRADETGACLRGAGWRITGHTAPRVDGWDRERRPRAAADVIGKTRWEPLWSRTNEANDDPV